MGAPRHRSRWARALLVLAAAAVLGAVCVPAASAHAFLVRTNPADGSTVAAAPRTLRLSFSEHVVLSATSIELVDGDGRHLPVSRLRLVTEDETDTEEPSALVADLPRLDRNTYRVSWETMSSDDLHRTSGVLVFGVGRTVAARGFTESLPAAGESALRWLVLLGAALALGGPLAGRVLRPEAGLARAVRRTALVSLLGGAGAAVVAVLLTADQLAPGGLGTARLVVSGYGARWLVREAGLIALALAPLAVLRGRRAVPSRPLLVLGAVLAGTGTALLGHAGAGARIDGSRVLAAAAHLTAALTWAGAVLCLALVLGLPGAGAAGRPAVRRALRRFGTPAAACVSVMAVTGVYLSSTVVGSVDAALRTFYGRALLLKLLLAGVAGALALANHLLLRRRRAGGPPTRTVRLEALVAVLVVAVTAVLSGGQPAMQAQLVHREVAPTAGPVDRQVDDLQETVSLRPNLPGRNVVLVDVFDTRRPAPAPVAAVLVSVAGSAPAPATALSDGRWSAGVSVVQQGRTGVVVTVRRPGLPDVRAEYPWVVGPAGPGGARVSTTPVGGWLRGAAGAAAAGAGLGWLLVLRRRRRPPARPRGADPTVGLPAHQPALSSPAASPAAGR